MSPTESPSASEGPMPVKPMVYIAAGVSAVSGILFGYELAGSGGTFVMDSFRQWAHWGPKPPEGGGEQAFVSDQQGWINAIFCLGCIFGSLPAGYLTDRYGRKNTIMGLSFIFTIGAVWQLVPSDMVTLYIARAISGFGVGGLNMAATLYQSEIAPTHVRGVVVSFQQLAITIGILLAAILNVGLAQWEEGWRISYGGKSVFSIFLFFAMFFMPESPRWLVAKGHIDEAEASLKRTRFPHEVAIELNEIELMVEEEKAKQLEMPAGRWIDLIGTEHMMWYRTLLGFTVQFVQQFSGINAVMTFNAVILNNFFDAKGALLGDMAVKLVNFFATFIALYAVDRAGRRILLFSGGLGMCVFTGLFALFTGAFDYQNNKGIQIALVCFVALYALCFAYSWGPLAWVVSAEVFPQNLRDKGMTLTTMANSISNFLIVKAVPLMIRPTSFGLWGTFLFFSCFCAFMMIFSVGLMPETRGADLEQMDEVFSEFSRTTLQDKLSSLITPEPSRLSADHSYNQSYVRKLMGEESKLGEVELGRVQEQSKPMPKIISMQELDLSTQ